MAKKKKCKCPKPGLSAPFYLLTYGDMMTLLLTFFVLLFSMSTIQKVKFQSQVGVMQGSLGISKFYQHAPMEQHMPRPAIKQSSKVISRSEVLPEANKPMAEASERDTFDPAKHDEEERLQQVRALGIQTMMVEGDYEDEYIIVLPTYGIYQRGEYQIDPSNPEVQRVTPLYRALAEQLSKLAEYDIYFTGHTDSTPVSKKVDFTEASHPRSNMELGFLRAVNLYEYFFSSDLRDRTRITFASQGDHIPIVPNATLDSERRQNRRVEIRLKKIKKSTGGPYASR